jgi:hypothetical protein
VNDLTVVGLEWLGALALFLGFILLVRYLNHRERMMLIERGLLDQLDVERPRTPRSSAMLRGGLITAMVGLAVTLGLYTMGYLLPAPFNAVPGRFGPWLLPGLIPLAVGLALVASYYLSPPRPAPVERREDETRAPDSALKDDQRRTGLHLLDPAPPAERTRRRDDAASG